MKETALITGITGQDGAHLAELFSTKATSYDDVHGIKRRSSLFNTDRIDHRYQDPHVDDQRLVLHYGDLKDPPTWSASFSRCSPTTSTTWQRRAMWRSASRSPNTPPMRMALERCGCWRRSASWVWRRKDTLLSDQHLRTLWAGAGDPTEGDNAAPTPAAHTRWPSCTHIGSA